MLPLDKMISVQLLIKDRQQYRTANIFGFIAYSERNPYVIKVLQDNVFWQSLNARTEGWILYAIKPNSSYFGGGNAEYINQCLGMQPNDYPQLVILGIGSNQVMMQRSYKIIGDSVETVYNSIEKNIDTITSALEFIYPEFKNSTRVHREVIKALDAELASARWKKAGKELASLAFALIKGCI